MILIAKRYLRPFEDWVTGLRREGLVAATLKWGAVYVLILCALLLLYNLIVALNQLAPPSVLEDGVLPAITRRMIVEETARQLSQNAMVIAFGVAIGAGVFGIMLMRLSGRRMQRVAAMQKRFIADTSHEMRTPLAIMKTGIEVALMQKDEITREEAIDILENNLTEVNSIATMMNALIALSRFEDPLHAPQFSPTDLSAVVRGAAARYEALARARRVSISATPMADYMIDGNESDLDIMFRNVIKNAIVYNKEGGTVEISLRPVFPRRVEVRVRDSGTGIPKEKLPHVFEPFFRVHDAPNTATTKDQVSNAPGSDEPIWTRPLGLGLAFVRAIARQHGGIIRLKSTVGVGTEFRITFPLG